MSDLNNYNPKEYEISVNSRSQIPISTNLVVSTKCNYNCRFCFGQYKGISNTPDESHILKIPRLLVEAGCQKLTLEGGEPFLFPQIFELVKKAKKVGLATCIVTNGYFVTKEKMKELSPYLDWIALSVDSASELIEFKLGRGNGEHISKCKKIAVWAHELNINLKINSVITSLNFHEDLTNLILELKPHRWKVFQLLQIEGENTETTKDLIITKEEFNHFRKLNNHIKKYGIDFVSESQDDMKGSYIMMLPDGRFISNHEGKYTFGRKTIFNSGVLNALNEVGWDEEKFSRRGGYYQYKNVAKSPTWGFTG